MGHLLNNRACNIRINACSYGNFYCIGVSELAIYAGKVNNIPSICISRKLIKKYPNGQNGSTNETLYTSPHCWLGSNVSTVMSSIVWIK